MDERQASCSCGQLTATIASAPIRISMCHCLACQRRTGSPFGAQARFDAATVVVRGTSKTYRRTGDAGGEIDFQFCPDCGSTVLYRQCEVPDQIAVPVGALAEPSFPAPTVSVYEDRKHTWVAVPDDIEHYD